jgi:hypothetical protein
MAINKKLYFTYSNNLLVSIKTSKAEPNLNVQSIQYAFHELFYFATYFLFFLYIFFSFLFILEY